MNPRRRSRETAFQILYRFDVEKKPDPAESLAPLKDLILQHFEHFQVPNDSREFAQNLVQGAIENQASLDEQIQTHSKKFKLERLSAVDRTLLRMAIFELTQIDEVPHTVTIDEAIELAKQFGTAESPGFVNAVLDNIAKKQ